ncbi:Dynein-1-beta heavy chain, flagellar inner arm I1 complex [Gossypium arboreum]|uniref:Dynein-1-beta heavy chain, flagellar inner arm I1 complex n=1 Tax=Gossypium arboreum TaxID=29729 RepID=A0A0B0MTM6_GOSAR|nr:Dynein-1-beta heavy chain, flagellar inner arm I1 complex [Gossypium arboreum]
MITPMFDLSISVFWHFLITVFESPKNSSLLRPMNNLNLTACNPVYASTTNGFTISKWMVVFNARILLSASRTISPKADLKAYWSKAASK